MVSLQSGGAVATVIAVDEKKLVHIAWFASDQTHHMAWFPAAAIKRLEEDEQYQRMKDLSRLQTELQMLNLQAQKDQLRSQKSGIHKPRRTPIKA